MYRLAAAIILAIALNADWAVAEGICDEATAIGPGKLQWAPPGIPVYNMNGAKVKCQ